MTSLWWGKKKLKSNTKKASSQVLVWHWLCVLMFKCLGWPCPATFIYLHLFIYFRDTNRDALVSVLAPQNTWCGSACFRAHVSSKYELDIVNGSFAIYVRWLFGWRYISSLHSADEPQEGRNSCPLLRSCFIGSCHVGVLKRFSRSISPAVYTVHLRDGCAPPPAPCP